MMPAEHTPPSSPVKKRPRLSSPENLVQTPSHAQPPLSFAKATTLLPIDVARSPNLGDDPDNPFTSQHPPHSSVPRSFGFASASSIKDVHTPSRERSPPEEQDYDAWFGPSTEILPVGFHSPSFASASSLTSQPTGFVSLGPKSIKAPSAAALAKAREQFKIWDENPEDTENSNPSEVNVPAPIHAQPAFHRPALRTMDNSFQTPSTPSPSGFSRPALSGKSPVVGHLRKPFRSPLTRNTQSKGFIGSPLNPQAQTASSSATNISSQRPTASTMPTTPLRLTSTTLRLSTPVPAPASPPRTTPAPFVTPFKPGMRPGERGWVKLQESVRKGGPQSAPQTPISRPHNISRQLTLKQHKSFFDLCPPPNRKTLITSGLRPQRFTQEDFESMEINILDLQQITPALAAYYSFHTASTLPPSQTDEPPQLLGPTAALEELHNLGCSLATKAWVDNHWGLILWKLAGMVALDPESESNTKTKRWCWAEAKRQLLYRYERELNQAKRPALRLISTQDAPAAFPMALCVSNILWSESEDAPGVTYPELEVTDGWYRLKAKVDVPMVRAVKRGVIRVGRKIGVAGARLDSGRKEPQEILGAYNSVKLVLSGNSTHLLPWDAKLGFMKGPCVSTMHSLTPDGGPIAAMDLVVVKSHAVAFIEFTVDSSGRKRREGPRGEAEEMKINEEWKKRREHESSKLHTDFENKVSRYQSYIDKLERRAGNTLRRCSDDEPPDHIENLYDQLEEHDDAMGLLSRITPHDAAWLAKHIRQCMEVERKRIGDAIERDLEATCPPRDVRSFRVVAVEDSQTCRRPANRYAQLTVWDVLSLTLSEGAKIGTIEAGSRFLITNLIPQQQGAWMGNAPNSQIFLATTRSTKWHKLKNR